MSRFGDTYMKKHIKMTICNHNRLVIMLAAMIISFANVLSAYAVACDICHDGTESRSALDGDSMDVDGYLRFLYRYMPLPDRYDYGEDFYRLNVETAVKARREMPWGTAVPEREFRHFVLPVRVNNEDLDSCRMVFYEQLRPRVCGLSMQEAILEVNHWCHERVTYRPGDARTSSPLNTIKTAFGRCGEESTLLVAALRSVAIPARQVYTPRWAHTDDNHAWVEAWADGKWFFLGACEPEPVLNLGWFNESASRGMLMHTKVFGDYDGPEEVMSRTPCYTEINVIGNYAPTAEVNVQVVDADGKPVADALVEFKLYNYAEFYTVAEKKTDAAGRTHLTAGKGDMLLWVSKEGMAAIRKVSFGKDRDVTVVLDGKELPTCTDWDMVPPPVSATLPTVTPQQRAENTRRLAQEDSIRRAYEQTMPVEAWRGNYQVISKYLEKTANRVMAERLLAVISPKDLRDIPLDVLMDNEVEKTDTSELYCRYVLNPRVENEWLTPYKAFFRKQLGDSVRNAADLTDWCRRNIRIDLEHNPQSLRMRPMSVYRKRVTDELGRKIFFVSVARSMGIPARINEVDGMLQYHENGSWHKVHFGADSQSTASEPTLLRLDYIPTANNEDPKYYIHFTLSELRNGRARLLTYPEEATWKKDFKGGVSIHVADGEREYLLTTGTRMSDGKVLARLQRFTLPIGQQPVTLAFTMREDREGVQVIGSFNAENLYLPLLGNKAAKSLLSTTGRGYYILGFVAPNQEPTDHALRDIIATRDDFEQWGRKIILLFGNEKEVNRFNFGAYEGLPNVVEWGIDPGGKCLEEIRGQMKLSSLSFPIFVICDTFNRVLFVQQGYTIHLGEQLLKVIGKL